MTTLAEESVEVALRGNSAYQEEFFGKMHLIDLGIIQHYNADGTADVLALYMNGGAQVTFTSVEVLYFGSGSGAFCCNPEGSLCLLFIPMTCVPNTSSLEINTAAPPFSAEGMKAIPVTRGDKSILHAGFDGFGNFLISGNTPIQITKNGAQMCFGEDSVSINVDEGLTKVLCGGRVSVLENADGTKRVLRLDDNGIAQYMLKVEADGSYTIKRNATVAFTDEDYEDLDAFTDWMWIETYNTDGSVTKILQQDADTPLLTHSVASNGNVTDTLSADSGMTYTLKVGDDVSIVVDGTAKSIKFTAGSVTEERKDGSWSISVNGPVTIESTTADLIKIKNTSSSLYKVLNDVISLLNGGTVATAGSPAAHTITAGQFSQALTDLGLLTGD